MSHESLLPPDRMTNQEKELYAELRRSFVFSKGNVGRQALYFVWLKQNGKFDLHQTSIEDILKNDLLIEQLARDAIQQHPYRFTNPYSTADAVCSQLRQLYNDSLSFERVYTLNSVPFEDLYYAKHLPRRIDLD